MGLSILAVLPLIWKGIVCQVPFPVPGFDISVNSSVSVQEGLCVTIPCSFIADGRKTFNNTSGYWIRRQAPENVYYIVATNDRSTAVKKTNFHLTGNPDTGDCTLTITDAKEEDNGIYYFRFVESRSSTLKYNYNREAITAITVTDFTEEPVISELGTLIAGVNKTLTCSPPRNCPATSLTFQWKASNVADVWKTESSTVTFTPSPNDQRKNITCEMTYKNWRTTRKTVLLDIDCPTIITITWDTGKKKNKLDNIIKVDEGSSVTLRCLVESNLTYQRYNVAWIDQENEVLQNGIGKMLELRLENVTMEDTGVYTCSVMTECAIHRANISISVQYPPRNMEITVQSSKGEELPVNQSVIINQTESVTLACQVDGNPPASVFWVKGEVEVETNKSASSAIINVTASIVDVYRCLAWNAFGLKEQRIQVGIKPIITTNKPENVSHSSYQDLAFAFLCGLSISILIILMYKLITWKKWWKDKNYMKAKEPSASAELPENEIYMNVSHSEHKAEESADASAQLDPIGVTSEEDLHYSTIAFSSKPSKVPPSQPETEYAEIIMK
ncbi:sialic acid-binding Ig-like lectin 13 isoform X1 [Ranitomeya variabilis]|uniref:sialic acid-binding Ig-like lectin 13 isoform X1 n=1 Tax=Ranitomeya variabilis TaxID=490064 RepID=UPI0040569692